MASKLIGNCNRCGLCCYVGPYRCINLIVMGKPGDPEATKCAVHGVRYDRMPILLLDTDGRIAGESVCGLDSEEETESIIEKGIGKGCSLELTEG